MTGRPPRSSRAEVVDVGLDLLRTDGLAAVTLGAIGDRLGLHKVALYTYVKNKEDLLLAMRDEVYRRQLDAYRDEEALSPQVALKAMCTHLLGLMTDYGQLMTALEPAVTGPGLEVGERFLEVLSRVGLAPRQQLQVYLLLSSLFFTTVGRGPTADAGEVDPQDFPRLQALVTEGVPQLATLTDETLAIVLDVLIPALRATPPERR
jgi:AcrR family transcriptional regulator